MNSDAHFILNRHDVLCPVTGMTTPAEAAAVFHATWPNTTGAPINDPTNTGRRGIVDSGGGVCVMSPYDNRIESLSIAARTIDRFQSDLILASCRCPD